MRKGHSHYLTIISDISNLNNTKILAVIDGRTVDDIRPFLERIPLRVLQNLEGISIDMSAGYYSALKELFKDTPEKFDEIVVIDRFHVAKLLGDKIDGERKKSIKALKEEYKDDATTLEELKNTMWPFRHHPDNLDDVETGRLNKLFEYSPNLKKCHALREELYALFEIKDITKEDAREKIDRWCIDTEEYETKGYNPFKAFVKTYRKFEEHILNYFTYRISSGAVEGLNNKIKVIKRRGFGFRNVLNFTKRLFLDINYRSVFMPSK